MPQTPDITFANQARSVVRVAINAIFEAITTDHSGPTAPPNPRAFMKWKDTSTSPATFRERNSANNAWIVIGLADTTNWGLATLASPTFTGTPAAPTAALGTNTTQLATTQFVRQHESWVSVLPGGWSGTWQVRRKADGDIQMEINATATNVTLAAYTQSATLTTLAATHRPARNLVLPTNIGITGVDLAAGLIYVDSTGAIRTESKTAASGNTYIVRGAWTYSSV